MACKQVLLFCGLGGRPQSVHWCRSATKSTRGEAPPTSGARAILSPDQSASRACSSSSVRRPGPPFIADPVELEAFEHGLDLPQRNVRGEALQAASHLPGAGAGIADQHQQHLDDGGRVQRAASVGGLAGVEAREAGAALAVGSLGIGGEVDRNAAETLAEGAVLAGGGEQEGVHVDAQDVAEFVVSETVLGFAEEALNGGAQGSVTGEVDVADGEQADGVEAVGIAVGVEAAIGL